MLTSIAVCIDGSAAVVAREAEVTVKVYPHQRDPADAILDVAEEQETDLVVMANKGMTGAKHFPLGSLPNEISIARGARC
jgi:nucleotide-binding universal stress UspA family protein